MNICHLSDRGILKVCNIVFSQQKLIAAGCCYPDAEVGKRYRLYHRSYRCRKDSICDLKVLVYHPSIPDHSASPRLSGIHQGSSHKKQDRWNTQGETFLKERIHCHCSLRYCHSTSPRGCNAAPSMYLDHPRVVVGQLSRGIRPCWGSRRGRCLGA